MNAQRRLGDKAADQARRLGALTDPARVQLMSLFGQDAAPLSVGEIAAALGIGRSVADTHLTVLVEAGLVIEERRGYRANDAYARCLPAIAEAVLGHPAAQP
jgi:DNA-binding transcriptional ArsR family regulator